MVVRKLLCFGLLHGANCASVSRDISGADFLSEWLSSLDLQFSMNDIPIGGLDLDLYGECNQIALGDIDAKDNGDDLEISVAGLAITCKIHTEFLFATVGIDMELVDTTMNFDLGITPYTPDDTNPTLQLPQTIALKNCGGNIALRKPLAFTVPRFLQHQFDLISPALSDFLSDPQVICLALHEGLTAAEGAIGKLDDKILHTLLQSRQDKGLDEAAFEDPNNDIAAIASNVAIPYIEKLLDTLSNASSPENINKLLRDHHGDRFSYGVGNDPTANIACWNNADEVCPLFPLSLELPVSTLGTVRVNVTSLAVAGLDSFSKIALRTPGLRMIDFALGLGNLTVDAEISLRAIPAASSDLAGDELLENFTLHIGLRDFALGITGFLHFNGTTVDQFDFLQLPHPGCISQTVNSTQVGLTHANLSLPGVEFSLKSTNKVPGAHSLEDGLDDLIDTLAQFVLGRYARAVDEGANWALSLLARDMINSKLTDYLALNVTDQDIPAPHPDTRVCLPPKPAYQSQLLHDWGLYGAIAATVLAAVALASVPFVTQRRNKVKQAPPPMDVPGGATALTAGSHDEAHDGFAGQEPLYNNADDQNNDDDKVSLSRNQKLPLGLRAGLPLLVVANAVLFISSNAGSGASIFVRLSANGQPVFALPPAFDFSLINTMVEMAQGQVWLLVFVIGFFSGIWPYAKLCMMLCCWFLPTGKLSINARHRLLEFLDAFGKWSLVDTYVLVLFVVAFSVNLECRTAADPVFADICIAAGVGDATFKLYVLPTVGFHEFVIATLLSLINGLVMSTCHRYVHKIGEFGDAEEYEDEDGMGNRRRLCTVLKDSSQFTSTGVTVGLALSFVLALVGSFLYTFKFVFQGIAGLAFGDDANRAYSLFGLGAELPAASIDPNTFGIHWIQFFFIAFSGVTVLIFLGLLLVLWNVPLTVKGQRTFLVLAQVMNAWSGLDVFVVAILACVMEISQFADFIVTDTGLSALNQYIPSAMAFFPQWNDQLNQNGGPNVFTLVTRLEPGFWLLAIAAILSTGVGQFTLNRCSKALFDTEHRPLTESMTASFTSSSASFRAGP